MDDKMLAEIMEAAEPPRVRNEKGQFLPGNKEAAGPAPSPGKRVGSYLRKRMIEALADGGKPALEKITDNTIAIACNSNPKYSKEAVWAARFLFEYAYGSPSKSEEELSAMRESGVQIAIVSLPSAPAPQVSVSPRLLAPEYDDES